jgi:hypothetical protein
LVSGRNLSTKTMAIAHRAAKLTMTQASPTPDSHVAFTSAYGWLALAVALAGRRAVNAARSR